MTIRAVISRDTPTPTSTFEELWIGSPANENEDAHGISTAAIASILNSIAPGTWYSLQDFSHAVATCNWISEQELWTILEIVHPSSHGNFSLPVEVKLSQSVKSMCQETVRYLEALEVSNVWVRLE